MADNHNIYLQLDVLLQADFFEKFCTTCFKYYSHDPIHITPLAWEAALGVDLQLITDVAMYHFVVNSIRSGISMISTRHAQANSRALPTRISSIWAQTICIGGQCLNLCSLMDFVLSNRMRFLSWSCKNYPTMLRMVIYSRWIFTIQPTYTIVTMTTRSPPCR